MPEEPLNRRLIRAIKQECLRLEDEWPMGGQIEDQMIERWRQRRPKMVARLEQAGILAEFAHLIECRRGEAMENYFKAGMGWPDSREEANRDWLLEDPEADDAPTRNLDDLLQLAAREHVPTQVRRTAATLRRQGLGSPPEQETQKP